jgi:hypothetical protein
MAFTAEEILRKMFPVQSEELILLMNIEKSLIYKFEELSKEEKSLFDLMLLRFDRQRLTCISERYKKLKSDKIQIRKQLMQTRIQLSNLSKQTIKV